MTLDDLLNADVLDPDALEYQAAVAAGHTTVAATLASNLQDRYPGLTLPAWTAANAEPVEREHSPGDLGMLLP